MKKHVTHAFKMIHVGPYKHYSITLCGRTSFHDAVEICDWENNWKKKVTCKNCHRGGMADALA